MLASLRKNRIGILFMLGSSVCVCVGQLLWKLSAGGGLWYLLGGFLLYGAGAVIMLIAYKHGSLSVLQPMLSMNYVFTIILAKIALDEIITPVKLAGVVLIAVSVILIGGGDN